MTSDRNLAPTGERPAGRLGIVVVTHNRRATLLSTLRRLTSLPDDVRIVVVDNASTDGTAGAVRAAFPAIEVVERSENIGAVARNDGIRRLERDYVAFADDDSWWAPGSLSRAVEIFDAQPRLGLIMSRILVGPEERLDPCCALMSRSPLPKRDGLPGAPILGFVACGAIARRRAFLEVGGFDERFGSSGEEALLAIDLARDGWELAYLDEIISHHHPSPSRDPRRRRIHGVADHLWVTWLRRHPRRVARVTLDAMRRGLIDAEHRHGLVMASRELPRILRQRQPAPDHLEAQLTLLDRQNGTG